MTDIKQMRSEFEAFMHSACGGRAIIGMFEVDENGDYVSPTIYATFYGWQAATQRATAITQTAMTDEKITQLWGDLQARNIKEKRERYKDQIGALCGACHVGTFFLNSNGYNDFPECAKCRHVPLFLDGVDMSAAAKKMREAIKPEQA